ncbi:MAG TPA: NPCBM/NEW2 domain-containing protein [Gemmataceae bacterium]|jgi:hypothetical protein|nr:NPCBM/NEW2 domain-containing protein [Gemmataceae bacterium]
MKRRHSWLRHAAPPHLFAVCLCLVVCAAAAGSADESPSARSFVLERADAGSVTGPLERLGEGWSVTLGGARSGRTDGDDVVWLRQARTPLPRFPEGEQVIFANGDRLPGKVLRLQRERLRLRFEGPAGEDDQELRLPLSALSVIWLATPAGTGEADVLRRKLAGEKRRRDAVYLRNGDVMEGILGSFDRASDLRMEVEKKPVKVAFNKVAAVALSTELARAPRPKGPYGHLVLDNGCRLALASARADGHTLTGKTLFGAQVRVALAQVRALDLYHARAVYLSELKPRDYEFRSYLGGEPLPYVADGSALDGLDGSVAGGDLRLGGGTYDKGLGMRSASRITYALGGDYRRFEALVGLDDVTGQAGSARIRVLVDGKPQDLGWDEEITWRKGPKSVRVNVAGARELTLVVDFGRHGPVQNHVNWADARLLK